MPGNKHEATKDESKEAAHANTLVETMVKIIRDAKAQVYKTMCSTGVNLVPHELMVGLQQEVVALMNLQQ